MKYKAAKKREIIDLAGSSSLPVRLTLDQLGIPKSTFQDWYERYRERGDDALVDGQPRSKRVWKTITRVTSRPGSCAMAWPQGTSATRLENYYLPGDRKARIGEFVEYYISERFHESLDNLTPEDVYTGRGNIVLNRRRRD